MNVKLYLFNYVTKADLKNATGIDTSDFSKKTDLAHLNSELEFTPADLSKLSNVVKMILLKRLNIMSYLKKLMLFRLLLLVIKAEYNKN